MEIGEFIAARLDEEEKRGSEPAHYHCEDCWYSCPKAIESCGSARTGSDECDCNAEQEAAAILARVAAVRALVAACSTPYELSGPPTADDCIAQEAVLRFVAAIWDWHPDYRPEWAPGA